LFLWITSGNQWIHFLLLIDDRGDQGNNLGQLTNRTRELDLLKSLVEDLLAGRPH